MFRASRLTRRVTTAALVLSVAAPLSATAHPDSADAGCAGVTRAVGVQWPDTDVLSGTVEGPSFPLSGGWLSTLDGSQTVPLGDAGQFELPLGTKTGEWYVAHISFFGCQEDLPPVAPNLVLVRNATRIQATSPEPFLNVPYGQRITAVGVLEGWTEATGWQPLAGRSLDVWRKWYDPSPMHVTTSATGGYSATVAALEVAAAGTAHFAGDDTWLEAAGGTFVQVHARISARPDDESPAVGQQVRVRGQVAPGSIPVRLDEFRDGAWTTVAAPVTASGSGDYVLRYRPTTAGEHRLRAWTDGTNPGGTFEGVYPHSREFTLLAG